MKSQQQQNVAHDPEQQKKVILTKLVQEVVSNTPLECNLKSLQVTLLHGIPHCGSAIESNFLPPGSVTLVNADTVLCKENRVVNGTVRAPTITAIFKIGNLLCTNSPTNDIEPLQFSLERSCKLSLKRCNNMAEKKEKF